MSMLVRGGVAPAGSALPATATTGQVLQWNGSAWVAATPSASGTTPNATPTVPGLVQLAGDLAGTATAPTVAKINGATPAAVATTGKYADLSGAPALAAVATTGSYSSLTGAPALATVATTGSYGDLTGRPLLATVATSGSYTDLSNKPAAGASVQFVAKAAQTDRTSTTTPALDPELVATVTPGTYLVEAYLAINCSSLYGLSLALGGTATRGTVSGGLIHAPNGTANWYATPWTGGTAAATTGATLSSSPLTARALVVVTAGGTLGLAFAQASTGGTAASLLPNSSLTLTKTA